ncbi:MAG: hypothetical protein HQM11_19420 [SAR324 cluster bacterium]|nr:hypothetical protein [SAR324 cluster bacterium]
METIEFETIAQNGTIAIPEQYRDLFPETIRLLVHIEPLVKNQNMSIPFKAIRISTRKFKFNREEANER